MGKPTKSVVESRTTRNQIASGAGIAGLLAAIIQAVRFYAPDLIPPPEVTGAVVAALTPIVSRWLASLGE